MSLSTFAGLAGRPSRGEWGAALTALAAAVALGAAGCVKDDPEPGRGDFVVPAMVSQDVNEGGPNPAPLVVSVQNRGSCGLAYTATTSTTDGAAWLSVAPAAGVIAAASMGSLTVSLDVVTTALPPGTYTGTITLAGTCETNGTPARGSPKLIGVNLRVAPIGATIAVDTTTIGVDLLPLANAWVDTAPRSAVATLTRGARAIWTGREMWVVGGKTATNTAAGQGGRYDPTTDTWAALAAPAALRYDHSAVWTGTEMIAFGGRSQTLASMTSGASLGIGDALWTNLATASEPAARYGHSAVWTGSLMVVWGGADAAGAALSTGGRYDPATDTWTTTNTTGAPTARSNHLAVWTGTEMIVFGGTNAVGAQLGDGKRYNPVTNTWASMASFAPLLVVVRERASAVWTGKELLVFGGSSGGVYLQQGRAYNPADDTWRALETVGQPSARHNHAAVWTGGLMIISGGEGDSEFFGDNSAYCETGAAYNPVTNTWTPLATTNSPGSLGYPAAVWTGSSMVLADITTADALLR